MISWSAAAAAATRHGESASPVGAWQDAADAAVDLAAAAGPDESIAIVVGPDSARLYPGFDTAGRFDLAGTRAATQRLVDDRTSR